MKILVEMTGAQEQQLADVAVRLKVAPEALAAAAVRDLVGQADADFAQAAARVLEKNQELYRRLS